MSRVRHSPPGGVTKFTLLRPPEGLNHDDERHPMPREEATTDVFAAAVPEDINPDDDTQRPALIRTLENLAYKYVLNQWRGQKKRPLEVRNMTSEWMITNKPDEIEKFQPAHDCAACLAGNDQARAYLHEHPGRWVALANLTYIEVWPS